MFSMERPYPGAPLSRCEYTAGDWSINFSLKRPEGSLWEIKHKGKVQGYAPTLVRAKERCTV